MHNHADQMPMVARHSHHLDKIRGTVVARLAAGHARIPPEKLILVEQHTSAVLTTRRNMIRPTATDLLNNGNAQSILAKHRQIARTRILAGIKQAMRVDKMRVAQAEFLGLLVHL